MKQQKICGDKIKEESENIYECYNGNKTVR